MAFALIFVTLLSSTESKFQAGRREGLAKQARSVFLKTFLEDPPSDLTVHLVRSMSHDHPQLQGLGSAPRDTGKYKVFTERIAALKKMGQGRRREQMLRVHIFVLEDTLCARHSAMLALCIVFHPHNL